MFVDGAHNFKRARLRFFLLDHDGNFFKYYIRIDFQVNNNLAKYETTIFGVVTSKKVGENSIVLHSDSRFLVNQHLGTFEAKDGKMWRYVERLKKECSNFTNFEIKQILRGKKCRYLGDFIVVCEVISNWIISIIVLTEANMEEVEKSARNIYEVTNSWFTPILNFLQDGAYPMIRKW